MKQKQKQFKDFSKGSTLHSKHPHTHTHIRTFNIKIRWMFVLVNIFVYTQPNPSNILLFIYEICICRVSCAVNYTITFRLMNKLLPQQNDKILFSCRRKSGKLWSNMHTLSAAASTSGFAWFCETGRQWRRSTDTVLLSAVFIQMLHPISHELLYILCATNVQVLAKVFLNFRGHEKGLHHFVADCEYNEKKKWKKKEINVNKCPID